MITICRGNEYHNRLQTIHSELLFIKVDNDINWTFINYRQLIKRVERQNEVKENKNEENEVKDKQKDKDKDEK